MLVVPTVTLANGTTLSIDTTGIDTTIRAAASSCPTSVSLVNGSFEQPLVPVTKLWDQFPTSSQSTGWLTANKDTMELWSPRMGVPPVDGDQLLELDSNRLGALYQDVATTPGQTLHWSLFHRGRIGVDKMQVLIGAGGKALAPDKQQPVIADGVGVWNRYTGNYTVPAGQTSTRFQLQAISSTGGGNLGNFVDDVTFGTDACLTAKTTVGSLNAAGVSTVTTTITNAGGSTATKISLSSLIPANATLVEIVGSTFTAAVPDLAPGQSTTVQFTMVPKAGLPTGAVVAVNASIDYVSDPPGTQLTAESSTGVLSGPSG